MKVIKWLDDNLELMFSSIFLVGMVISVALQVLSRYLMRSPISWTEEATRYLFIWMVFTSIGITAKRGKHIRITILQAKFPKAKHVLNLFSDLCFIFVSCVCFRYGLVIVDTIKAAGQRSSALPVYKWQVYLIVPIGFGLAVFRLCQDMWINIKEMKAGAKTGEEVQA